MNNVENYIGLCACDIAHALNEGSLDPVEITTFVLDKIATQNSPIFIETFAERALHEAHCSRQRAKSGARLSKFDGIPIAWKDLIDIKDWPTTAASKIYEELKIHCQPIAINSGYVWPKKGYKKTNQEITISILKPINPGLTKENFINIIEKNIYSELDLMN